ncbi:hypothetical protein M422DRAFT_37854 [Sphaerobolus stellatus SS14]|uniref:Uncharacterized protein n=1 Tax=Sphaerobolus stellatus (strain SS14) TaxID=990650 RepID=A0A0C9UPB4_SPHS4|nr:hypothetical protein M422DRAFT_37854 [Sphaerobolus stellatus SS14]
MTEAARIWEESTDMVECAALRVGTSMPIRHVHTIIKNIPFNLTMSSANRLIKSAIFLSS